MDNIKLFGNWVLVKRDCNGNILSKITQKNVILNVGKEKVAKLLCGLDTLFFTTIAIGIGTSTDGPQETDTGLYIEVSGRTATRSYIADNKCQFYCRFLINNTGTITEAGIKGSGVFLNHTMFDPPISLVKGQYLDVYCIITVN